ncbi:MAG: zf-HC2 domain-containing protein [Planctomycetes bacterium]|nr:zf-HC2 domain-containing protein [Planctomycetota bacterium]
MNCDRAHALLTDYLGDEIDPADRKLFDEHLAACPACRTEAETLADALQSLRQLPPPAAAAGLAASGDRQRPIYPSWARWYRPLAYAAMLLIGIGIGWFVRPDPAPAPNLPTAPDRTMPAPASRAEHRWPENRFFRNAVALSSAFSRYTSD